MTNLMTWIFCVDRTTLLKMLLFWIILPRGRGELIHLPGEKATLATCNYSSAVLNNKSIFKYVTVYNPHLIGSGHQCWGQLIHAGVS